MCWPDWTISTESAGPAVKVFHPANSIPFVMLARPNRDSELPFVASLMVLYLTIGVIYLVLPIAHEFGGVLLGTRLIPQDVLLTSGIMEWGFRSIFSSTRRFFDWNAGFPLRNSLAVTENLVGWQIFYYPLRAIGVGVAGAYNTVLLVSLLASAIGGALLARRLGASRWGAALAGLIFGYGPFHLNSMMHIQTMSVCWTPFAILFLDRYLEKPNAYDAFGLGASFVMTVLTGLYFAVFLTLILPLYVLAAWICGRHQLNANVVGRLAGIGLIAAATASPIALPYVRFAAEHGRYQARTETIVGLSMEWLAPARTPFFQLAWSRSPLRWANPWDGQAAFMGVIGLGLLVIGIGDYKRGNSARAVVLTLVTLSLISYLLALGPYFKTAGRGPYRIIEWVPMPGRLWLVTPGIRNPSRFFFFAWLGGAILAGLGLSALQRRIRSPWGYVFAACAMLLMVLEYWPAKELAGESMRVSPPLAMSDSYPFLANEADSGGVIEFPTSDSTRKRLDLGRYIYGASGHLRRVVALHGNRKIPLIDSLREAAVRLPDDSGRVFLSSHGVTRLVIHRFLGNSAVNARMIDTLLAARYPLVFNGRESVVFAIR
jgi:hypothetical protein